MNLIKLSLVFISLAFSGCATVVDLTKSGDGNQSPLPDNCDVTIYTMAPSKPFVEVGVMQIRKCGSFKSCPRTAKEAKEVYSKYVCQLGGNGVLFPSSQGFFNYLDATAVFVEK